MKVSDKKKRALCCAISDPIIDLRIRIAKGTVPPSRGELDAMLFALETEIWKKSKAALNIEGE